MSDDAARMNRFSLRFADATLEASFAEEQARTSQRPLRLAMLWAGGIVLVSWALFGVAFPQIPNVHARFAVPMVVTLGVLALAYAFSDTTRFLRFQQPIAVTGMCVMSAVIVGFVSLMPRATIASAGLFLVVLHTFNTYTLLISDLPQPREWPKRG